MNLRKSKFVEDLCDNAWISSQTGIGEAKNYITRNKPLPERLKPGRFIMSLSPEDREIIKTLTSKDFQHRIK